MYTAMSSAKSWHNQALGQAQAKESIDAASRYGIVEAIKRHLAAGTDVNAKTLSGMTPLHNAAREGRSETIKILIANGADVNAKSVVGSSPLDMATNTDARFNHPESADLLRKHGSKHSSNHEAAAVGDAEGVKGFLAAGTDVNTKDDLSRTPLDYAEGELADLLRKHGGKTGAELKGVGN